nr:surface protein-like [Lytechinus pictus]
MVVQPTETMNTQTDVTIITEVITALESTDKDKSMKSSSMEADTTGKLTEETMTSKPATRIETGTSLMDTNESPKATKELSMVTNDSPTATNVLPMATNESPVATNESPMATNESPMDISLSSLATIVTLDTTDKTFTMEVTKAVPEDDDAEVTTVDLVKDVTAEDGIEHVVTTEPVHVIEATWVYAPTSRETRTTGAPMLLDTTLVPETTSSMMTTSEVSTTADVTTRDTTTRESTTDNVYGETETPDNSTALIEGRFMFAFEPHMLSNLCIC